MQEYVLATDQCRSTMLLRYFGEQSSDSCGVCDVCLAESKRKLTDADFHRIHQAIISKLKDAPLEADRFFLPQEHPIQVEQVMDYMRAREELLMDGRFLVLGKVRE